MSNDPVLCRMKEIKSIKSELDKEYNELLLVAVEKYGNDDIEGSKTSVVGDLKVSVTKPMTYKLENKEYEAQTIASQMNQEELIRFMKFEAKLNVKEYKTLEKIVEAGAEPDSRNAQLLKAIQSILTIKQGKPQVKIDLVG